MKQPFRRSQTHPIPLIPKIFQRYRCFFLFSLLLHFALLCLTLWLFWPATLLPRPPEQEFTVGLDASLEPTASRLGDGPPQGELQKTPIPQPVPSASKNPSAPNDTATPAPNTTATNTEPTVGVGGEPVEGKPQLALNKQKLEELFSGGGHPVYYSRNPGARKLGLDRYGGTAQSEDAVAAGLSWLIRHQDADGKWDGHDFARHCRGSQPCDGPGNNKYTPGLTALAFMCFLAAGHTPTTGDYRDRLMATQKYLLSCQDEAGYFGQDMYNHALVTLAFIEWYGQGHDVRLAQPIRRALQATVMAQQPGGGWSYEAKPAQSRNDTSVTGWQLLHLVAARNVGFGVPPETLARAWGHFDRFTLAAGEVRYADIGPQAFRKTQALAAVGLLCALVYGQCGEAQKQQVRMIRQDLPAWDKLGSLDHSMYYWYHAHLAMFAIGGPAWQAWNEKLQRTLLQHQVKSGEAKGSWPPDDKWGNSGGRLYSTTLNILNLEIYYRYQPSFLHGLSPAQLQSLREK